MDNNQQQESRSNNEEDEEDDEGSETIKDQDDTEESSSEESGLTVVISRRSRANDSPPPRIKGYTFFANQVKGLSDTLCSSKVPDKLARYYPKDKRCAIVKTATGDGPNSLQVGDIIVLTRCQPPRLASVSEVYGSYRKDFGVYRPVSPLP